MPRNDSNIGIKVRMVPIFPIQESKQAAKLLKIFFIVLSKRLNVILIYQLLISWKSLRKNSVGEFVRSSNSFARRK